MDDVLALFVDENYKPVKAEKANKKLGMPDVFLTKGAKTFIKNKGSSATFSATGFSNGKEGLIIDYKPYPKFVGEKDTTKPTDNLVAGKPLIRLGNVSTPTPGGA